MAAKSKTDLKDVFNGLSSVIYQATAIDLSGNSIALDSTYYDMPVTVDTLSFIQDDPTINHYKVIGIEGDWTSSSTSGDVSLSFTVPTKHTDVLTIAYGSSAVTTPPSLTYDGGTFSGKAVKLSTHKITGSIVLVDAAQENIMILSNIALWAKPLYENASTDPFAIQFTGTIEASASPDIAFLKKQVSNG